MASASSHWQVEDLKTTGNMEWSNLSEEFITKICIRARVHKVDSGGGHTKE